MLQSKLASFIIQACLIISTGLHSFAENVQNSPTGGLNDSWENEPLLTF